MQVKPAAGQLGRHVDPRPQEHPVSHPQLGPTR